MSAGRRLCNAIVWLWMGVVNVCRIITRRSAKNSRKSNATTGNVTSPATGQEMEEWEETWNTMEPFTVTVVPSDQSDHDLFQDMQPVLKKTKKVYIGGQKGVEEKPDKHKFAVETEFSDLGTGELGVWEEERHDALSGWEGEIEGSELLVVSREIIAQQRREEREKRRKLQEALRFNQRKQPCSLGTRLSDS